MCDTIWGVQTKRREGGLNEPMCFIIHGSRNSYTASIRRNTVSDSGQTKSRPNGMRLREFRCCQQSKRSKGACATKVYHR
jgi:hypothetical protein